MLVLTRKPQERIQIGETITVTILKIKGNSIRVGIEAPRDVHVVRAELPRFSAEVELTCEGEEDEGEPLPGGSLRQRVRARKQVLDLLGEAV